MIPTLAAALDAQGYDTLTPVQEAVTESGLETQDLLVSAQTGSGKTVGFGLAIGPTILPPDGVFGPAATPLAPNAGRISSWQHPDACATTSCAGPLICQRRGLW